MQGRVWAIQPKYLMIMQSPPSQTPGVEGPRADATELPRFNAARRNAVPRGEDLALSKLAVPRAPLAFGALLGTAGEKGARRARKCVDAPGT